MHQKICFFDVDHTITRHSTGMLFAKEALRRGVFALRSFSAIPWYFFLYRFGSFTPDFFQREFGALKGISLSQYEDIAEEAFRRSVMADCYPGALRLMRNLKEGGGKVVLATFSLDFIVSPLARFIQADGVISSSFEFSEGISTGRFGKTPVFGPEKLRRVEEYAKNEGVSLGDCSFYSDSFHDLPLLEAIGRPVAANPDHRLMREARKRGWDFVIF